MKKIIFLDLDGTLITVRSKCKFPKGIYDMTLRMDVFTALKYFIDKQNISSEEFVYCCIISNQGGIEAGIIDQDDFDIKISYVAKSLQEFLSTKSLKVIVDAIYCTSVNKDDIRRKPNTGMIWEAKHNCESIIPNCIGLLKENMIMIGDASGKKGDFSSTDLQTAHNAGIDYMDVEELVKSFGIISNKD